MVVESDSEGRLVPEFYDLYLKSVDRWARRGEIPFWLLRTYLRHHESRRKFEVVGRTRFINVATPTAAGFSRDRTMGILTLVNRETDLERVPVTLP